MISSIHKTLKTQNESMLHSNFCCHTKDPLIFSSEKRNKLCDFPPLFLYNKTCQNSIDKWNLNVLITPGAWICNVLHVSFRSSPSHLEFQGKVPQSISPHLFFFFHLDAIFQEISLILLWDQMFSWGLHGPLLFWNGAYAIAFTTMKEIRRKLKQLNMQHLFPLFYSEIFQAYLRQKIKLSQMFEWTVEAGDLDLGL